MKLKTFFAIIIVVFCLIFVYKIVGKEVCNKFLTDFKNPIRYEKIVEKYCKEYNVDEALVFAIIKNESKFYPYAKSKNDSYGLMQVQKETFNHIKNIIRFDNDDIYDIETNIKAGVFYISYLLDIFQNESYAILAYNAGPNSVNQWIKRGFLKSDLDYREFNIPYIETNYYIGNVIESKRIYKEKLKEKGSYKKNTNLDKKLDMLLKEVD